MTIVGFSQPRALRALRLAVVGSVALLIRPVANISAIATALVGVAGLVVPLARARRSSAATWLAVTAAGAGAFTLVARASVLPPLRLGPAAIGTLVLAAVAEELFFRRALYGMLAERGHAVAIVVTAVLFALVHIPVYGIAVLPLDVAAGLVFGWQRYATGTWTSSAVTHTVANLLQVAR
jgi:membrane protease YdiL (CAAX protease family)